MAEEKRARKITITKGGPYIVEGNVPLAEKIITPDGKAYKYEDGKELPQSETYGLCRCGKSKNPPFCDGVHVEFGYDGTEVASKEKFLDRLEQTVDGPDLDLQDDGRCALARFCHRQKGDAWELTRSSDNPEDRDEAIIAAKECPAGRLVAVGKDGEVYEPEYEPAIEILQDPEKDVSGPISVKGNIPIISADGEAYEVRNRVTLCRCGESENKPFCDGKHIRTKYKDHK